MRATQSDIAKFDLIETVGLTGLKARLHPGWDTFDEPLNYSSSSVLWVPDPVRHRLAVRYTLIGARPSKLYQVGVHIFCNTFPSTFGQFPTFSTLGRGRCETVTRQNVTCSVIAVEFGVVLTDIHGNGTVEISVTGIAPGAYHLQFTVRNGAGCNVIGGAPGTTACGAVYQEPAPFGNRVAITV